MIILHTKIISYIVDIIILCRCICDGESCKRSFDSSNNCSSYCGDLCLCCCECCYHVQIVPEEKIKVHSLYIPYYEQDYSCVLLSSKPPIATMQQSRGESVYQTHGIAKPTIETGISAEYSLTCSTARDSPANTQMPVCSTNKGRGESVYQTNVAYGIIKPAIEPGTSAEFSLTNHTEHDSQDMAVDVAPNEACGVTSANTQMPVCSTNKGRGESVYQTNVAYGIIKPAIEPGTSAEFSLTNHTEHDSQDMAVDVAPNKAYGVTSVNIQMTVCSTDKVRGESVYQTNVAYGITKPVTEPGTSTEFSLTYLTAHNLAVDVAPNEAYGVTSTRAQMTVCR